MADSRSDPATRKAAVMLSALLLATDAELEAFRERRAADRSVDLEHLKRARALLDAVAQAITKRDGARWKRIEEAWQILDEDASSDFRQAPVAAAEIGGSIRETKTGLGDRRGAGWTSRLADAHGPVAATPPPSPVAALSSAAAALPSPAAALPSPVAAPPSPAAAPPPPAAASPSPVASPPSPAAPTEVEDEASYDLNGTLPVDDVNIADVLPFGVGRVAVGAPPTDKATGQAGATAGVIDPHLIAAIALPFKNKTAKDAPASQPAPAALDDHLRAITLEMYAALCAERAEYPSDVERVRWRYRVRNAEQLGLLDGWWIKRFETEQGLRAEFEQHYRHARDWFRSQRGDGG